MKLLRTVLLAAFSLAACLIAPAHAQQQQSPPTLHDFLGASNYWNFELSPSGRYLAGIHRIEFTDFIIVADLDDPSAPLKTINVDDVFVEWLEWATDDKLLAAIEGHFDYTKKRMISREDRLKIQQGEEARKIGVYSKSSFQSLISIDRETEAVTPLTTPSKYGFLNMLLPEVTDFLPDDPDHIIMPSRQKLDLDLYRVNIVDGSHERIAKANNNTYDWRTDLNGVPAFRFDRNNRGTSVYIYARESRKNGKIKWKKIHTVRMKRNKKIQEHTEFEILYPGPTETTYYVSARINDDNTAGIHLYDFQKEEFIETVALDSQFDIHNAIFNTSTREIEGVYYRPHRTKVIMRDSTIQAHLDGLNKNFNNEANILPIDTNRDATRWLLYVSGPRDAGSFHIYDVNKATLSLIGNRKTSLSTKALAPTELIEFEARDGVKITGYLTTPANTDDATKPPFIMLPHGGPEARDYFDFSQDAQLLAAYGYQVFQPNFRGSAGFGKEFADSGRLQWGKAMSDDVDDAYLHLVKTGHVEHGNACIVGASYGGYEALVSATRASDKYRCAVAIAAPSNLVSMMKWERKQEGSNSETYKYWDKHIGNPKKDKSALKAASPTEQVDRIQIPILLIHGEQDKSVPIKQSELMLKALEGAGKDVAFVRLEKSGHSYHPLDEEEELYRRLLDFLEEHFEAPLNSPSAASE